jgi:hypothetical protein
VSDKVKIAVTEQAAIDLIKSVDARVKSLNEALSTVDLDQPQDEGEFYMVEERRRLRRFRKELAEMIRWDSNE